MKPLRDLILVWHAWGMTNEYETPVLRAKVKTY
jgi:hypothetical protein